MQIGVERINQPLAVSAYVYSKTEQQVLKPNLVTIIKRWHDAALPYYLHSCTMIVDGIKFKEIGNSKWVFNVGSLKLPKRSKPVSVCAHGYQELFGCVGFEVYLPKSSGKGSITFLPTRTINDKIEDKQEYKTHAECIIGNVSSG